VVSVLSGGSGSSYSPAGSGTALIISLAFFRYPLSLIGLGGFVSANITVTGGTNLYLLVGAGGSAGEILALCFLKNLIFWFCFV
jgi:hypothetical protein